MALDLTKIPKLGFGLMRLPEKDGAIDIERVKMMVDKYISAGIGRVAFHINLILKFGQILCDVVTL